MASPSEDATPIWDIISPEDDNAIMEKFTSESNKVIKRWSLGSASFAEKDAAVSFLEQLGAVQITIQSGSQQTAAQKQVSILFGDEEHKKTDQERDEADPGDTKDAIPSGGNSFPPPVFLDQDTKKKSETPVSLEQDTKEKREAQINDDDGDEDNNYSVWMSEPDDGDDDDNQISDPAPVVENSSATRPREEHPCPDCDMVLHSMWELDLHKLLSCKNKTPNHVYNCDQCSKSFSAKSCTVTHLRKVHNMSPIKAVEKLTDLKSTERQNRRKVSESKEMRITSNKQSTKSSQQSSSKCLRSEEKADNDSGRKSKISKVAWRKARDSRNMQGAKQQKQSGPKRRVGKQSHRYSEENEPRRSKRLCIRLQPLANGWIQILESETDVNKLTSNSLSNEPNKTAVVSNNEIPKSIHTSDEHQNLNCNTESDTCKPSPMSESEPLDINEEREASAGIPIQADATEKSGMKLTALKSDELQDHGQAEQVGEKQKENPIPTREVETLIADRETENAETMPMLQNSEAEVEEDHGRKLTVLPSEGCTAGQIREESQDASTTSHIERDRQRSDPEINEIHEGTCESSKRIEKKNLNETTKKETKEVNSVGVSDHDNNVTTNPKSTGNKKISRTCMFCDLQFKSIYLRQQHMLKIHVQEDVQEYKCSTCNRPFINKQAFTVHLKTHMDINDREKYCCKICNKTYLSKYLYQTHMKSHVEKPGALKCDTCGTVLASKRSLERHINSKHIKEIVYTCEVCGKNFYNTSTGKVHLESHKERTWKCDQCGAAFFNENGLKVHKKQVHTTSVQCLCEICGSAFKTPGNLKQHNLTAHTDVYKFSCDVCGKKFKRSSLHSAHMKRHSNDPKNKRFKCEICNKFFRVASKLKVHMDWHYNIRSHTCDVCDKSFLTKGNLDKHKYIHLPGKRPHVCRICSQGFLDLPGLRKHLDVKHKITLKKVLMKGVRSERIEGSAANGLPDHELENRPSSPSTSVSDCDDRLVVCEAGHQESSINAAQVSEASDGQKERHYWP